MKRIIIFLLTLFVFAAQQAWTQAISAWEFWFDDHYEAKTSTNIDPVSVFFLDAGIPTDHLDPGIHVLHIRFRDSEARWSTPLSQVFFKGGQYVTVCEYWFNDDADPVVIQLSGSHGNDVLVSGISTESLSAGMHKLHLRFRDSDGRWSPVETRLFWKTGQTLSGFVYWFDDDREGMQSGSMSGERSETWTFGMPVETALSVDQMHMRFLDASEYWSVVVSLDVNFSLPIYTLTYLVGDGGNLEGETTQEVEHGADGSPVEAVADDGHHFVKWSDERTDNPRTDSQVTADLEVTAQFSINTYQITAEANNNSFGTVTGSGEYEHGQQVALTAVSSDVVNFIFTEWTENGTAVHGQAEYVFEATADRSLVANFKNVTHVHIPVGNEAGVEVFPVPAGNTLSIGSDIMIKEVRLYDLRGRMYFSARVNDQKHTINVSGLRPGFYVLQVVTEQGVSTKKIQLRR